MLVSQLRFSSLIDDKLMQKNFVFFFISFHLLSTKNAFLLKKMPKIRSFCTHLIDIFPIYQTLISDDSLVAVLPTPVLLAPDL
jgi:hypothetical protein